MKAIQFSGGKDSLAVLYLMRDSLAGMTVYFGNTGIVYPHMVQFVRDTCKKLGAHLKEVSPGFPIGEFHRRAGLPADIVPVEASSAMQPFISAKRPFLLQSSLTCCAAMLWKPLDDALVADGITDVYRGSKAADGHVGVPDGYKDDRGITYHSPIWDWTDADVFAYLKEVGAEMPEHYGEVNNSFDCIFCTAFLNHAGAAARLRWTKDKYPEVWPEIEGRLKIVKGVLDRERDEIDAALSVADGDSVGNF